MLTGHATVQTAVEAVKHGAMDYLQKPCDIEDLLAKAQKAAQRKENAAKPSCLKPGPNRISRSGERSELISKILEQ